MEIMVKILNLSTRAAAGISFWAKRGANLAESNLLPQYQLSTIPRGS